MSAFLDLLNEVPLAGLMLVVALGFTVGRLTLHGMSLGPAGGTLGVAIVLGHLGLDLTLLYGETTPTLTVGAFGFALFIYSVGFEAGPSFFSTILGGPGWRFAFVGTMVNGLALVLAVLAGRLLDLGEALTAGLLSGALTSAPTYAAAAELTMDETGLAVSFALVYPLGLVGMVLLVQFLPRWMGDDLVKEADDDRPTSSKERPDSELTRAFEVVNETLVGRSLRELDLTHSTGVYVTRIHRGSEILVPEADLVLEPRDHVLVRGRLEELEAFRALAGAEVYDEELRRRMPAPRKMAVLAPEAVGRTLADLAFPRRFRTLIVGIDRRGVQLDPAGDLTLVRGDILEVVGSRSDLRHMSEEVGRFERASDETDVAVYAGGIFLGLLLGSLKTDVLGFRFSLGMAGGLLLAGVILGRFRRIGPFRAHVPRAARQLVRDLGILLFVAEAGVQAGGSMTGEIVATMGPLLAAGVVVSLVPVVGAVLIARRFLGMRAVDAWGSAAGGMTSSAALTAVRRAADSNQPALSYATSYAVASVLVTLAGQLVVVLMR